MAKIKKVFSIRIKFIIISIICGLLFFFSSRFILIDSLNKLETENVESRLQTDINYIRDLIGEGQWNLKDNALYLGDVLIGDGTEEKANYEPFLDCERKTGTFSYTFMKVGDEGLQWTGDDKTGYMQGHFYRTAGSTKGPNGESIVGTYMDKKVADVLDEKGIYTGPANVAGRQIYCIYETLNDENGKVVGAIVVGRSVQELEKQINSTFLNHLVIVIITCIIVLILLFITITPWISIISQIGKYLGIIVTGTFPDEPLKHNSRDEIGELANGINEMVDSLREKELLRHMANTDNLTGLLNRAAFQSELKLYIMDSHKPEGSLFMIDMDHFKEINDTLGHPVGDELLKDISNTFIDIFRGEDLIGRLGGDEFICFAKGFTNRELLEKRCKQLNERCRLKYKTPDNEEITVTLSIGVAVLPEDGSDYETLYENADHALYQAKTAGRDCYRFYEHIKNTDKPI